ncbi:MAG: hypothetical protein U9N81_03970 [Bacillota bacterium]|nr:hypothetical protein [Bacillota bacterium]
MFRKNDTPLQDDLFKHYRTMKPSIAKMLEKSWAPVFYEEPINRDLKKNGVHIDELSLFIVEQDMVDKSQGAMESPGRRLTADTRRS